MFNFRHITNNERVALRRMADDTGVVEMLRCIAGIIAHDHPEPIDGTNLRSEICFIAKKIALQPEPIVASTEEGKI